MSITSGITLNKQKLLLGDKVKFTKTVEIEGILVGIDGESDTGDYYFYVRQGSELVHITAKPHTDETVLVEVEELPE